MAGSFIDAAASPSDVHQVLRGFEGLWSTAILNRLNAAPPPDPVAPRRPLDAPAALAEILDRLLDRGIVEAGSRVIELGLRLPRLAERTAVDGRSRRGAPEPASRIGSGCVLGQTAARSIDVVVSVDCFPLLTERGDDLPSRVIGEVARVLRPGGHLVIVGFSDRGDTARDRYDLVEASVPHELVVVEMAESPLTECDAAWFHLRRPLR